MSTEKDREEDRDAYLYAIEWQEMLRGDGRKVLRRHPEIIESPSCKSYESAVPQSEVDEMLREQVEPKAWKLSERDKTPPTE